MRKEQQHHLVDEKQILGKVTTATRETSSSRNLRIFCPPLNNYVLFASLLYSSGPRSFTRNGFCFLNFIASMEKHDSVVEAKRQEKNNILSFFVNGKDNILSSVVHEKDNVFILIYSLSYNGRGQR